MLPALDIQAVVISAQVNRVTPATGGLADVVAPATETIQMVDQHLLLKGLRLIYEMNQKA